MVDNENQWDETYNSEDMKDQDEYSSEELEDGTYSDDEYDKEDAEEEYEEDNEEEYDDFQNPPRKSGNIVLILLVILLLIIAGAVFMLLPKLKNSQVQTADNGQQNQIEVTQDDIGLELNNSEQGSGEGAKESMQDVGDKFFEQAGGNATDMMSVDFSNTNDNTANVTTNGENGEIVASVTPAEGSNKNVSAGDDLFAQGDLSLPTKNNDTIMISYNPTSRVNPFKPPVISPKEDKSYQLLNTTDFEIIEPPAASEPDENLTMLLQTQISGILYDDESPSAIIKLNGKDQFVKKGDVISGYKVQSITKDKVLVSYKNNSYVASVGQLFTRGELEKKPAVANLENKFAGRYKNN